MSKHSGDSHKHVSSENLVMVTIPRAVLSPALWLAYQELFKVVFKIPSQSVKTRVLHAVVNALNGDSPVRSCKCSFKVETSDGSTQTISGETHTEAEEKSADKQKSQIHPVGGVVKLGRKRKVLTPQASTGTDLGISLPGRLNTRHSSEVKLNSPKAILEPVQELSREIEADIDSYSNINEMVSEFEKQMTTSDKAVQSMMFKDWVECNKPKDGYLPIHNAVMNSDEIYLRRQCITLNFRGLGVDQKIFDGSTALHLALKCNVDIQLLETLLKYGAKVSEIDNDGNNSILLAAKYSQDINIFTLILRKTSFSELQRENFNSHGIFRIVVDSGRFDFINKLMSYVDECLKLPSLLPESLDNEKDIAKKYHERLAELTDMDKVKYIKINEVKAKMVNHRDKTAGKTPLFCAVEKKRDNIVLALLANLADPRIKTFAGFDAYIVANEVVKSKKISLALISALNAFESIDAYDGSISSGTKNIRKLEEDDDEPVRERKRKKV